MFEIAEELEESQAVFSLRDWHDEIQAALGPSPRTFSTEMADVWRVKPPVWAGWGGHDAEVFVKQWSLARSGDLVFGHIIQVNNLIFTPGEHDVPGSLVYSRDPYYVDHPEELDALARELGAAKGRGGTPDTRFQRIVDGLIDEMDRMTGVPIPPEALDGREAFMTSVMFHRKHLPQGLLNFAAPIPLLVSNETEGITRMVPSEYWGTLDLKAAAH